MIKCSCGVFGVREVLELHCGFWVFEDFWTPSVFTNLVDTVSMFCSVGCLRVCVCDFQGQLGLIRVPIVFRYRTLKLVRFAACNVGVT